MSKQKEIAVLSDIHGNYIALQTCLKEALVRGIDTFMFLGDYVAELPYPQKTMEMMYDMDRHYNCYFVRGNKEDYWLEHYEGGDAGWENYHSTTGALLYTYSRLTKEDMRFFRSLPIVRGVSIEGFPSITICHGSPRKVDDKLREDKTETYEILEAEEANLLLCGHTHYQMLIHHKGKMLLNPGSVGVPLGSDGKAQFLILHGEAGHWEPELVSMDYDVEKMIDEMRESGLYEYAPSWTLVTENLLRKGNISHAQVLMRAMSICREKTGECIWPHIPEECWEQAIREMIV